MAERRWNPGPIIAAVLLLLPVLYVGSYLALVTPGGYTKTISGVTTTISPQSYRWGEPGIARFFWPLEKIDRRLRPGPWDAPNDIRWPDS
jgi:hypothetical protein